MKRQALVSMLLVALVLTLLVTPVCAAKITITRWLNPWRIDLLALPRAGSHRRGFSQWVKKNSKDYINVEVKARL